LQKEVLNLRTKKKKGKTS